MLPSDLPDPLASVRDALAEMRAHEDLAAAVLGYDRHALPLASLAGDLAAFSSVALANQLGAFREAIVGPSLPDLYTPPPPPPPVRRDPPVVVHLHVHVTAPTDPEPDR